MVSCAITSLVPLFCVLFGKFKREKKLEIAGATEGVLNLVLRGVETTQAGQVSRCLT